jgi:Ca2+-binding EF-hand superfamily protein
MAALTAGLTREETDAYSAAFERYDADHSGSIDEEELSCILEEQAGIKPSAKEMHELKETWMGHMHSTDQIFVDDFMHRMAAVRSAGRVTSSIFQVVCEVVSACALQMNVEQAEIGIAQMCVPFFHFV